MACNRIHLKNALENSEYAKIDQFASGLSGTSDLGLVVDFMNSQFGMDAAVDKDIVGGFVHDSSNLPGEAHALCRPRTERECAVVLRVCSACGIPCTVSAGRSNLTGSATPEEGMILATVNLVSPEPEPDLESRTVSAPVGMILEDLRNCVLKATGKKLHFPVDPTSRADATVGGAVACNASGFTPGDAGAIRHWIKSIDFLTPDGMKICASRGDYVSESACFVLEHDGKERSVPVPMYARPGIKNAGGPYSDPGGVMDFVDLVVGSEGIFGLVTGVTLALEERPADHLDLFFSLPDEEDALKVLSWIRDNVPGGPGALSAVEYFGPNCRKYMDHEELLFKGTDPVAVYLQVPLKDREMEDAAEEWLEFLMETGATIDEDAIMLMDSDRDRTVFLEARHSMPANALEVVQHRGTFTIMTDTVVPPENFGEFLEFAHGAIQAESLDYLAFGHLGDCHLHFTILPEKEQMDAGRGVYDAIVARSAELGGVYSGEHGTGKRKRADFKACYGAEGIRQVKACKAAFDPRFLLNRGNVVTP